MLCLDPKTKTSTDVYLERLKNDWKSEIDGERQSESDYTTPVMKQLVIWILGLIECPALLMMKFIKVLGRGRGRGGGGVNAHSACTKGKLITIPDKPFMKEKKIDIHIGLL